VWPLRVVPNRAEARRVRAIFKRAANGQTPSEIARKIDHLGWRTKQWESKRSGEAVGGGRWTARQVISVLRNPVYLGAFAEAGSTRPGCHDPIVDTGMFEAAQKQLDDRRTVSKSPRTPIEFPLRGKLVCPKCRRRLCTYTVTRRHGMTTIGYRYYRCRSTAGGRAPCRGVQYPAGEVEQAARDSLADPQSWQTMIDAGADVQSAPADLIAMVWSGLDTPSQNGLLAQIIASIEFARSNSEMRMSFTDNLRAAISPVIQAFTDGDCLPGGCE